MRTRGVLAGAVGLGITVAAALSPGAFVDQRAPILRAVLDTAVALVGTLVAVLEFGRFRRSRNAADLAIVCAVVLLAWVHTLFGTLPDVISPHSVGNGVSERFEVWGSSVVRMAAAGLMLASVKTVRTETTGGSATRTGGYRPLLVIAATAVLGVILLVIFAPIGGKGLLDGFAWPQSGPSLLQLPGAVLFFVAFLGLLRRAEERSDSFLGWIAAGCVFGGFAMISYALLPPGRADWVRSGDVLNAAALFTWAMGSVAEIHAYWSAIARLARAETRRAIAFDLHDGLAQDLALLNSLTYAPAHEQSQAEWHELLRTTAERALAEGRRAIAALAADQDLALPGGTPELAEVRIAFDGVQPARVWTDSVQRESVLSIVREAVTNAIQHGRASRIDVLYQASGSPTLRVRDDGRGFDPGELSTSGHLGLMGMRERAAALGASLTIDTALGQGTTVEVVWP